MEVFKSRIFGTEMTEVNSDEERNIQWRTDHGCFAPGREWGTFFWAVTRTWHEQCQFLQVASQIRWDGRKYDVWNESDGRGKPASEAHVCRDDYAIWALKSIPWIDLAKQWLWTYNNDRPNMAIGRITPRYETNNSRISSTDEPH